MFDLGILSFLGIFNSDRSVSRKTRPMGGVPAKRDLQRAIQTKKSILITGMPRLVGGEHHYWFC